MMKSEPVAGTDHCFDTIHPMLIHEVIKFPLRCCTAFSVNTRTTSCISSQWYALFGEDVQFEYFRL